MSPERWQQVREILDIALDQPPSRRSAWLEQACAGDRQLRLEADAFLTFHEETDTFLSRPACSLLARGGGDTLTLKPGQRLGPYRILRPLARGGMGAVYLALRKDGFTKKVAIKVLRSSMNTEGIVRRFEQERQILAQLEHPAIARLLDGGTTDGGLPYFVMEHVVGKPIDKFCKDRKLSVAERLLLFRRVCSAVAFAHRNLVVHRDLKPSNILVTPEGEPKLLDFGIARLLAPQDPPTGFENRPCPRSMTPGYASPEQLLGEGVTTASDVFSLGVLLWELLTGERLYPTGASVLGRSCNEAPPAPSSVVRGLRGDLDSIVARALAKQPAHRYPSVGQLSEDLGRYLEGLPVLAHRRSSAYLVGRFIHRHWLRLAVAVCVLLLAAGAVLSLRRKSIELEEALRSNTELEHMLRQVFSSFDPYDPDTGPFWDDFLDREAERVRESTTMSVEKRARLLSSIARAHASRGDYAAAVELLQEALELREETPGSNPPDPAGDRNHYREVEGHN